MWIEWNKNPAGRRVGDCSVRAVSIALGVDWETAYAMTASAGFNMADIQNSNSVIGAVLRQHGFYRHIIPNECPDCFTVKDFCEAHPQGTYVLFTNGHVLTVKDGNWIDAWDSGNEIVLYFWSKEA